MMEDTENKQDDELSMLRMMINKHMDTGNYYIANRYLSLLEDLTERPEEPVPLSS